jgi:hypothetical protein
MNVYDLHTEFHIDISRGLLVIAVKLKVNANFWVASNFFYIYINKSYMLI